MSIVLDATTKSLELVCGSTGTASNLQWMTSYADKSSTSFTPGTSDGVSNGTTDVVIVAAPGADEQRLVNNINIYNADTVGADVTVNLDNDGTERILVKTELNSGNTLQYANDQWRVVDENGAYKQTITADADNISIADAGDIITAKDVEGALQENRSALDLNTTHRGLSAAVHGLPANVNVLGNRNASGEFIQRGTATGSTTGEATLYVGYINVITYPVAFTTIHGVFGGGINTDATGGFMIAFDITSSEFDIAIAGVDGTLATQTGYWLAIGS